MTEFKNFEPYFKPVFKRLLIIPEPVCLLHVRGPIVFFLLTVAFVGRFLQETLSYFAQKVLPSGSVTFLAIARLHNKILSRTIF